MESNACVVKQDGTIKHISHGLTLFKALDLVSVFGRPLLAVRPSGNRRLVAVLILALISGLVNVAWSKDTEPSAQVLRLTMSFDEVKFLGMKSNGTPEFSVEPRIELQYRPIDLTGPIRVRTLAIPVSIFGDRVSLARDGCQGFQLTDPDGVDVRCFTPEPVMSNATLLLTPRHTISCLLSNGFGAEITKIGTYRLSLRVVLIDDEGKNVEADVSGTFKIDTIPSGRSAKK